MAGLTGTVWLGIIIMEFGIGRGNGLLSWMEMMDDYYQFGTVGQLVVQS